MMNLARHGRAAAALVAAGIAVATTAWSAPALAQARDIMRAQTQQIQRAIQNQLRQAVRPQLAIRNSPGPVERIAIGTVGATVATVLQNGTICIWDLDRGFERQRVRPGGRPRAIALSPDETRLFVALDGGRIEVWDLMTNTAVGRLEGHRATVTALEVSADGAALVSASEDGTVRLWDAAQLRPSHEFRGHARAVRAVAIGANRLVAASAGEDGTVRLWDLQSGRALDTFSNVAAVSGVRFGADPATVFSAGSDGMLRQWRRGAAQPVRQVNVGNGAVSSLAANYRGGSLATVSADGTVDTFAIETLAQRAEMQAPAGSTPTVVFDVNGGRVFSSGPDGTVRVTDAGSGAAVMQMISTQNGWVVLDGQGRFDGSEQGMVDIRWLAANQDLALDNFSQGYFEPGLLARRLANNTAFASPAPAPVPEGFLLPPRAEIAVSAPTGTPATVDVTVRAEDQGGGVAAVVLRHNGRVQGGTAVVSDQTATINNAQVRTVVVRVPLSPGQNVFEAAGVGANEIEGEPAVSSLDNPAPPSVPRMHVLVVGINKYADASLNLDYGVPDALTLLKQLSSSTRGLFREIVAYQITDESATRANILRSLQVLQASAPEDVVLIYLAGHGEVVNKEWYFLPHEIASPTPDEIARKGIPSRELRNRIFEVGADRVMLLIDSCKSGSGIRNFDDFVDRRMLRDVGRSTGVAVVAATRKDQLAAEIRTLGHGAFTYVVLDGLRGGAAGARQAGGTVTAQAIVRFVENSLPLLTRRMINWAQYPATYTRGADFPIAAAARN
ncbi:MAG: caspase family protein [Rhodospirillales bacterium]